MGPAWTAWRWPGVHLSPDDERRQERLPLDLDPQLRLPLEPGEEVAA